MQKEIYFDSDEFKLHGTLHLPESEKPPVVIGSHGLLSTGESPKQIALAEKCVKHNIAFFRYDHRGCGKSTGEFSLATTFKGRCRDLRNAVKTVSELRETGDAIALFGSSFGGAVSLALAVELNICSIVTMAAPLSSATIKEPYVNDPKNIPLIQRLDREKLFFDIRDQISSVSHLLIFHGDNDQIVPFTNALYLKKNANPPVMLIRQNGGDHQMSNKNHQQEFLTRATEWITAFFA